MRIGLHAGPVYRVREPLLDRQNFFGFHMNQAATHSPLNNAPSSRSSEPTSARPKTIGLGHIPSCSAIAPINPAPAGRNASQIRRR